MAKDISQASPHIEGLSLNGTRRRLGMIADPQSPPHERWALVEIVIKEEPYEVRVKLSDLRALVDKLK